MVNTRPLKNLWVAASDGDIERVKQILATDGLNANSKDENHYTPMHAAASYAHLELLDYLISVGGDINIADDDGETPLYTVESVETARFLVSKGADIAWRNSDGVTPAESLMEDFPEVGMFLISLDPQQGHTLAGQDREGLEPVDGVADNMLAQAQAIMSAADADGSDPDERLRAIVSQAVQNGLMGSSFSNEEVEDVSAKRPRTE